MVFAATVVHEERSALPNDFVGRLAARQRQDLESIASMIARGDDEDVVKTRWSRFVKEVSAGAIPVDVNALVQAVLRESYLESIDDLAFHARKVKFTNEQKSAMNSFVASVRSTAGRDELENYIDRLERGLSTLGNDSTLAKIDLLDALQRQHRMLQTLSAIFRVLHDTATALVRNMR